VWKTALGFDAGILATMLLVWNIWDAVNDPLMGTIMDITFTKAKPVKDKFRPWLIYSIPLLILGCISFFVVPPMMGGGLLCWQQSSF
jgi:Na+/melibiose symporter-like transporter